MAYFLKVSFSIWLFFPILFIKVHSYKAIQSQWNWFCSHTQEGCNFYLIFYFYSCCINYSGNLSKSVLQQPARGESWQFFCPHFVFECCRKKLTFLHQLSIIDTRHGLSFTKISWHDFYFSFFFVVRIKNCLMWYAR